MRMREFLDRLFKREPARQAAAPGGENRSTEPAASRSVERRLDPDPPREDAVQRRQRRAADRILENENLTADLEDDIADPLINWGVAWASQAAGDTAGLDDEQAEDTLLAQNRAVRQVIRQVGQLASEAQDLDEESARATLAQISAQAAILRPGSEPPDSEQEAEFLRQLPELKKEPARMVRALRSLYDHNDEQPSTPRSAREDR